MLDDFWQIYRFWRKTWGKFRGIKSFQIFGLRFLDDEIENQFFQDTTIEEEIVMGDQGSDDTSRGPYKKYEPMTIQQLESLLPGNLFLQFMRWDYNPPALLMNQL